MGQIATANTRDLNHKDQPVREPGLFGRQDNRLPGDRYPTQRLHKPMIRHQPTGLLVFHSSEVEDDDMKDNTQRFSNRVENNIQYRPCYPEGVFENLKAKCQLSETSIIADIGSGTGLFAEGFLHLGCLVYGVEPNHQMREAGERLLQKYDRFRSISGTAEQTTLARESIDFVTAGQAFHWFDPQKARGEFQRILKPSG